MTRNPSRFRLSRAGIHQVWQYDETFLFGDGRLLLRGKNGAGKSKALEILLPYLLDGDTRRIDATGGGKTTLRWLMLDGWTKGTNRLGYLWAEFVRQSEDGEFQRVTVGAAVRASSSTGEARPLYFVTDLAVGDDLPLHDPARRPTLDKLRELVGVEHCFDRAADYRAQVARTLFGLTDLARYRNLIHLLYGLRRPTIGDRIESGELVKVLSDALPPLDDDVLDRVARNLDDLETVRAELARLERTDAALSTFLTSYQGYLRGVLRARVGSVTALLTGLRQARRAAGDAERELAGTREAEAEADARLTALQDAREQADAELRTLLGSSAYRAVADLRDKRTALEAVIGGTRAVWATAELARSGEAQAAGALAAEVEQIGAEVRELRGQGRQAGQTARGCGVAENLVGEPAALRPSPIAAAQTVALTDPDGGRHEVTRARVDRLAADSADLLGGWGARLADTLTVVRGRRRAADALAGQLAQVAKAEQTARGRRAEAERIEGQLGEARERELTEADRLQAASAALRDEVAGWARRLPVAEPLLALVGGADDTPLPADAGAAVQRLAHEVTGPELARLRAERDAAVRAVGGWESRLAEARAEQKRWEKQRDPEPPRAPHHTAGRDLAAGAPLYLLVDFRADASSAGLEAALEAAGLLNAWVTADGVALDAHTADIVLRPEPAVAGPSLADVLAPLAGHGVGAGPLTALLRGIGLGPSAAPSWVATDGRWRLGTAAGAHAKPAAEYIGAGQRAATRLRRLAELAALVEELDAGLESARIGQTALEERIEALTQALREAPRGDDLARAWAVAEAAVAESARLAGALSLARTAAEQALAEAVALRTRVHGRATADGLPLTLPELDALRDGLLRLNNQVDGVRRDIDRCRSRLAGHERTHQAWQDARTAREGAEQAYQAAFGELTAARRELQVLTETVGAAESSILAREATARQAVSAADRALPGLREGYQRARDHRVEAAAAQHRAVEALGAQEGAVLAGSSALRGPLGLPGLMPAAGIGPLDEVLTAFDATAQDDVRARVTALRGLVEEVERHLGAASHDVSDSLILKRGEDLRDGLAGGYDARSEETDGIKRFTLEDDTGSHDVAIVGARIRQAAAAARDQLSTREQEVFERYLLGELGDHLSRQVLTARGLVDTMNDTLAQVRSSHGIGARLVWEPAAGNDADVAAAIRLLERPAALRGREQSAQLRDVLSRQIEQQRLADPTAGYATHLRAALDYRSWFTFKVRVTDLADPSRVRTLSHRTGLSQGEQRVVSYLVLFATAAAHFSSLGRGTPTAPRMILLDDAFAKVDEPTHGRLLGLLVELDLDFVLTSERLWGCFDTVPSLHIYECLRDPHVRGVATLHFTWDGRNRRLVSA